MIAFGMFLLCVLVGGPAIVKIVRARRALRNADQVVDSVARRWEGQ